MINYIKKLIHSTEDYWKGNECLKSDIKNIYKPHGNNTERQKKYEITQILGR